MAIRQVRRLPVVDADERLIGIVSIGTLAEASGEPATVCSMIKAFRPPVGASESS